MVAAGCIMTMAATGEMRSKEAATAIGCSLVVKGQGPRKYYSFSARHAGSVGFDSYRWGLDHLDNFYPTCCLLAVNSSRWAVQKSFFC